MTSPLGEKRTPSGSPFRLEMPTITPGQLAFTAVQFLPVPLLVLDSLKTVVMANEAMGRLLGMTDEPAGHGEEMVPVMDRLRGQSLSQVGIDMLQDGLLVWVDWNKFLDQMIMEFDKGGSGRHEAVPSDRACDGKDKESPTAGVGANSGESAVDGDAETRPLNGSLPNAVVEVVISTRNLNRSTFDSRDQSQSSQTYAKMIITVWEVEEHQTYITLTFTKTDPTPSPITGGGRKSIAKSNVLEVADRRTVPVISNPSSLVSQDSNSPSHRLGAGPLSLSSSPFPPLGPPSKTSMSGAPSILLKVIMMKDALLDNTQTPIVAMWKDGSVIFPNKGLCCTERDQAHYLYVL